MKNIFALRISFLILLLGIIAFSCVDHRQPEPRRFRLASITYTEPYEQNVFFSKFFIKYDAQGRLAGYDLGPDSGSSRWSIFYEQNKVSYVRYFFNISPYTNTYTYNSQGLLSRIDNYQTIYPNRVPAEELLYQFSFIYDRNSSLPSAKRVVNAKDTLNKIEESYTFENGNAVKINGQTINYDGAPNPYYGLVGLNTLVTLVPYPSNPVVARTSLSGRFSDLTVKLFNRNNITNDAVLTYNSDGMVTRIAYTDGRAEEFSYEQY